MKTFKIKLPRKTILFHIGFTNEPNVKAFEDDVKAYFNNKYPRLNFNNENDFAFNYSDQQAPKVFVDKLITRMQSSTVFKAALFNDLEVIGKKYGYQTIQLPLRYK